MSKIGPLFFHVVVHCSVLKFGLLTGEAFEIQYKGKIKLLLLSRWVD